MCRDGNFSVPGVDPAATFESEMSMKRYDDPKWAQSMQLSLDHNFAMAEFLGDNGLTETDLQALTPR
ncbi:MAG: hypothetical protein Q8L00_04650, partial [Deltaproteobacteria bacterium]|nr:hypothetical protein [Deltaproteobacteria bacterium]